MQNKVHRLLNLRFTFLEFPEQAVFAMYWLQKEWLSCISVDELYFLLGKLQKDYSFSVLCKYLYEHQTTLRIGEENKHMSLRHRNVLKKSHASVALGI